MFYFVTDNEERFIRAGTTKLDPERRVALMEAGCPLKLKLYAIAQEIFHPMGEDAAWLPDGSERYWEHGRWYRFEPEIKTHIDNWVKNHLYERVCSLGPHSLRS